MEQGTYPLNFTEQLSVYRKVSASGAQRLAAMEEETPSNIVSEDQGLLGGQTRSNANSAPVNEGDFEKQLLKKMDWKLVPVAAMVVLICYVDRGERNLESLLWKLLCVCWLMVTKI